jgi:hypothetical protein
MHRPIVQRASWLIPIAKSYAHTPIPAEPELIRTAELRCRRRGCEIAAAQHRCSSLEDCVVSLSLLLQRLGTQAPQL